MTITRIYRGQTLSQRRLIALLALLLIFASSCSEQGESGGKIEHLTGSGQLIFQIEERDPFNPTASATEAPLLSLYGDGTLVIQEPDGGDAEGGTEAPITYRLNENGIQHILRAARDAGLLNGDTRFAGPYEDVSQTRFTVNVSDGSSITVVDGLHVTDPAGIPPGERDARRKLSDLVQMALNRAEWLAGDLLATP